MSSELSNKILYLRKKHNLTLEQVADIVGVGKSTVRKWETGMIQNMRRDKIALLAKALHTTPAFLMGWNSEISENEAILLELFRQVPAEHQEMVLGMIRVAIGNQVPPKSQ